MITPLSQFIIYEIVQYITNYTYYSLVGYTIIIGYSKYSLNNTIMCYLLRALIDTVYNITVILLGIRIEIQYIIIYNSMIIIIIYNIIGLMPYAFTITSHFSLTIGMSLLTIISCTIIGIIRNTSEFFILFIPTGTPIALAPLLIIIETISYTARSISLGLRLGANLLTGHSLMLILSYYLHTLTIPLLIILLILYIMEIAISILQAYVYILLNNSYLYDTIYLH